MSNIPQEVEPVSLILALILFVFVSPILLAVVFSFLFFFVREFFIEPLVTSSMWRWVAPQTDWLMTSEGSASRAHSALGMRFGSEHLHYRWPSGAAVSPSPYGWPGTESRPVTRKFVLRFRTHTASEN